MISPYPSPAVPLRAKDDFSPLSFRARERGIQTGFTLVELLVVIAIIGLLAALLFPVFLTARGKAREVGCISNLRQIGLSVAMYAEDNDGLYPFAVDPADRYTPEIWNSQPLFQSLIPYMSMLHEALQPYAKSPEIFRCPADTGFTIQDFTGIPLDATPTSYKRFGTSYYYRTEIAFRQAGDATFQYPSQLNVLFDGAGKWHGSLLPLSQRYVTLFGDGHTKTLPRAELDRIWALPL